MVPRGLSGGPVLVNSVRNEIFLVGQAIGNEMTDMIVHSFREKNEDGNTISQYEKTETLHRGIAIQSSSLIEVKSSILGTTIGQHLKSNGLLR